MPTRRPSRPGENDGQGDRGARGRAARTVYRHFPDAATLFGACSASYSARHPAPDVAAWAAIAAPDARLRRALSELYSWYSEVEAMSPKVTRDVEVLPPAMQQEFLASLRHGRGAHGRPLERGRSRTRVSAAVAHAIDFSTWHSPTRAHRLRDDEAVRLMAAMVEAAVRPTPSSSPPSSAPSLAPAAAEALGLFSSRNATPGPVPAVGADRLSAWRSDAAADDRLHRRAFNSTTGA